MNERILKTLKGFEKGGRSDTIRKEEQYRYYVDMISYHEYLRYFKDLQEIDFHHYIIGLSFSYAWMPTMLRMKLDIDRMYELLNILNRVKLGESIVTAEIEALLQISGVSIVGISKLLHFINPDGYAIIDSRVAKAIGININYNISHDAENYIYYISGVRKVIRDNPELIQDLKNVIYKREIGMDFSDIRAVEFVLYVEGKPPLSEHAL